MAVRGEYSDMEKEILADFEKQAEPRQGWTLETAMFTKMKPTVTVEALKGYAAGLDPWNPLWNLEEYAAATRWGSLIAHPFFLERFKPGEHMMPTRKGLFVTFYLMGHDFEMYQPIHPGDTIRAWEYRPTIEDSTNLNGQEPRKYRYVDGQCIWINQRNEIIGNFKQFVEVTMHEGRPPVDKYMDDYGYTLKELDFLADMVENEKPRGKEILYWEDVDEGDSMGTITDGPTDFMPGIGGAPPAPPGEVPKRTMPRYMEPLGGPVMFGYVPDRDTGLIYPTHGGRHNSDRPAQFEGGPRAWIYNVQSRYPMMRLVTNWIGDDGFVCKFSWRHIWRTPVGDALLINGKVAKKYVEDGEHMVDVSAWCLNLRGTITDMATATVKLISKEDEYPNAKKVVNR